MTKKGNGRSGGKGGGRRPLTGRPWEKGQSGNPKGRPKKKPDQPFDDDMVDLILAEAARVITLNEGGKRVSMPAAEAVLKAQLISAMKGNSHAQRNWLQQVAKAKTQQQKRKEDTVAAALALKIQLEAERNQWLAKGHDELAMALHPSDVEIDGITGEVRNFLVFTEEHRKARAKLVEFRDHLLERIARSLAVAAEDGDDELLQISRDAAHACIVDINQKLPPRFRRVPPGDKPPVGPDSSPEEMWRAVMQPVWDLLLSPLRTDDGVAGGSDWPSSEPECDASTGRPGDETTASDGLKASGQDDGGEES